MRQALLQMGVHYLVNFKGVPGTPDIAFPRAKKAALVRGCFWHVHPECAGRNLRGLNRDNRAFWREKLTRNVLRDRRDVAALEASGWQVLIIWEFETRGMRYLRVRLRCSPSGRWLRGGAF